MPVVKEQEKKKPNKRFEQIAIRKVKNGWLIRLESKDSSNHEIHVFQTLEAAYEELFSAIEREGYDLVEHTNFW